MKVREQSMVPRAEFESYYGKPVLKRPVWKVPDVPLYFFLGGMAGAAAPMALLADATGRHRLAAVGRFLAASGALASVVALVHDLGNPRRFLNMLRIFRPTSPLSVGSWILAPFSAAATGAVVSKSTGLFPPLGRLASGVAAVTGPALCSYTAVLVADTAVPAWHEAYPQLPFVFAGSGLASASGAAMVLAPGTEQGPARRAAVFGAVMELTALRRVERRGDLVTEPYRTGRAGRLLTAARALTGAGAVLGAAAEVAAEVADGISGRGTGSGGRSVRRVRVASRLLAGIGGVALVAGGLCSRFGVFDAGLASAEDPAYVVVPQRERLRRAEPAGPVGTATPQG